MQFNSYSYLLLLVVLVPVCWAIPASLRRWYVLALSVLFYASWSPFFLLAPIALCLGVFAAAVRIASGGGDADGGIGKSQHRWFVAAIVYALSFLVFFRYQALWWPLLAGMLRAFGHAPARTAIQITVPLGISFYSFEAISYLVDIRQGRTKPTRFSDLFLFVMFWPHLIAGPIVRFRELAPQFTFKKSFDMAMLLRGMDRLILGIAQKNLIADSLGSFVDDGFATQLSQANTTIDNWFLAIAFGLQIYFDFASYSNMAIGVAQLIGIQLPENFRYPYHASTPADFWQRWHMTLSRWIRDYLFFPINMRFQAAPLPLYLSLLGVMALVGLWHGAGYGFVLWGVLHGCYLVLYRIYENAQKKHWPRLEKSVAAGLFWKLFTLVAVFAAWIPFRATGYAQATAMLRSMFVHFSFGVTQPLNFYLVVLLAMVYTAIEPALQGMFTKMDKWTAQTAYRAAMQAYLLRPAIYAFGLLLFLAFDERNTQFLYFQF
jgi:alginate O-acetyltransferase complex protein AlgI